jgi:Dyp-type peroxidase family
MARDLNLEPVFPTDEIQGDILPGLPKKHEHLIFFQIKDRVAFKKFLQTLDITSMKECIAKRDAIKVKKDARDATIISTPGLNIAFTFHGLVTLGVPGLDVPDQLDAFRKGMAARQTTLLDPPASTWATLKPDPNLHGVFILTGASHAEIVDVISLRLVPAGQNGWQKLTEEVGQVRPDPVEGHEHFGYADGVSQPGVRGRIDNGRPLTPNADPVGHENQGMLGQDLLWPGEFVFGFPGQDKTKPITQAGPVKQPPVPFMNRGAFLVFRRLAQLVPEFNASVKQASAAITGSSDKASPDLMGAQMVGRWKSGAPLILAPTADDPTKADGTDQVNDFEFDNDRDGVKCPWAAHIRKAYPRNDVPGNTTPTEAETEHAESETQTHRMMRRGIAFGPELTDDEALSGVSAGGSNTRGLLFKCYVTSIENQFEFVQDQWVNAAGFSQSGAGVDPIIGQSNAAARPFQGAAPFTGIVANKPSMNLKSFVHMQGGEYFFAPSISLLKLL